MNTNVKKLNFGTIILFSMLVSVVAGVIMGEHAQILAPLGQIFIRLIKMLVVPLIIVSIISGATSMRGIRSAGKIGILTFGYYLLTTIIAVIIGLVLSTLFKPGIGISLNNIIDHAPKAMQSSQTGIVQTIIEIIPANIFHSFDSSNILQILFFCLFFGFGLAAMPNEKSAPVVNFVNSITEVLLWMINKIMFFAAPIGVFALMANAVGAFGWKVMGRLIELSLIFLFGAGLQVFGVYITVVRNKKSNILGSSGFNKFFL